MGIQYETTQTTTVDITPAELARLFWNLDDTEQAEFFAAMPSVIAEGRDEIQYKMAAEGQWYYMGRAVMRDQVARMVLQSMAAGVYEHTLRYCDKQYANRDMPWFSEAGIKR